MAFSYRTDLKQNCDELVVNTESSPNSLSHAILSPFRVLSIWDARATPPSLLVCHMNSPRLKRMKSIVSRQSHSRVLIVNFAEWSMSPHLFEVMWASFPRLIASTAANFLSRHIYAQRTRVHTIDRHDRARDSRNIHSMSNTLIPVCQCQQHAINTRITESFCHFIKK